MLNLYNNNGFIFWTEEQIRVRRMIEERLVFVVGQNLKKQNRAWELIQVEAPLLTPRPLVNCDGDNIFMPAVLAFNDVPIYDNIALRPETTMGSYVYAKHLLNYHGVHLPVCIWQHGKIFRREEDQPQKRMRLKESYQLEFQCLYGLTTAKDYQPELLEVLVKEFTQLLGACRAEASYRLPDYSEATTNIILCENNMELCSISKRKDFRQNVKLKDDNGRELTDSIQAAHCLEVSVGTDCVMAVYLNLLGD